MSAAEPAAEPEVGLIARFRASYEVLCREIAKFGVVGAAAFVVNTGVFSLLRTGRIGGEHSLAEKPITAQTVAVFLSMIVAYAGSRWWTFRHRKPAPHQFLLFVVFNLVGWLISIGCLAVSHYVLGLHSTLSDNIAANGVGLVLGTLFRFWAYKTFVFTSPDEIAYLEDAPLDAPVDGAPTDDGPSAEVLNLRPRQAAPAPRATEDEAVQPQRRQA